MLHFGFDHLLDCEDLSHHVGIVDLVYLVTK